MLYYFARRCYTLNQQKIERYANEARDLAQEKQISIPLAAYHVAQKYDISTRTLTRELGRRGGRTSKRHPKKVPIPKIAPVAPLSEQELILERKINLFYARRNRGFALARENELRRSFELAGHLDDY